MELILATGMGLLLGAGGLGVRQLLAHNVARKLELRVRQTISKCFSKSGLEVEVACIKRKSGLLVCIESEPSKKLRFSYIKEQALVQHVERTTGQKIERIFWRFRMKDKEGEKALTTSVNADAMLAPGESDFEERKSLSARKSDFEVGEVAWDDFAEFVHQNPGASITATQFNRIAGNSV